MKKVKESIIEKVIPTRLILIEEKEYKRHLIEDLDVPKAKADIMWDKISIERKKDEYSENRKEKERKEKKKLDKKLSKF